MCMAPFDQCRVVPPALGRQPTFEELTASFDGNAVNADSLEGHACPNLPTAVFAGHERCVELAIEAGADVEAIARLLVAGVELQLRPLMLAAIAGTYDCARALLAAGAQIEGSTSSCYHRTPLWLAARHGRDECVQLFVGAGASLEARDSAHGGTALLAAALAGHNASLALLIQNRAALEAKEKFGQTALMHAASRGYPTCAEVLLTAGADVEAKNKSGQTSLSLAAAKGHLTCVEALLGAGADVEARTKTGKTPLMAAATGGHEGCLARLLQAGAALEVKDKQSKTALARAAQEGQLTCLNALITAGAHLEPTAFWLAASNCHDACATRLLEAGQELIRVFRP